MTIQQGDYLLVPHGVDGPRIAIPSAPAAVLGDHIVPARCADGVDVAMALDPLEEAGQAGTVAVAADGRRVGLTMLTQETVSCLGCVLPATLGVSITWAFNPLCRLDCWCEDDGSCWFTSPLYEAATLLQAVSQLRFAFADPPGYPEGCYWSNVQLAADFQTPTFSAVCSCSVVHPDTGKTLEGGLYPPLVVLRVFPYGDNFRIELKACASGGFWYDTVAEYPILTPEDLYFPPSFVNTVAKVTKAPCSSGDLDYLAIGVDDWDDATYGPDWECPDQPGEYLVIGGSARLF